MTIPGLSCYMLLRCVIPKRIGVPLIPGSVQAVLDLTIAHCFLNCARVKRVWH